MGWPDGIRIAAKQATNSYAAHKHQTKFDLSASPVAPGGPPVSAPRAAGLVCEPWSVPSAPEPSRLTSGVHMPGRGFASLFLKQATAASYMVLR